MLRFIQLDERRLPSTLTVTSPLDAGAGTLRQAILDAQDGDVIDFSAALRGRTITLTSGELAIAKSLAIDGLSADRLRVDGVGAGRVFHVTAGAAVRIADLTIANGLADQGGGLLNEGGQVTLTGVRLVHNQVVGPTPGSTGRGGAVASLGADASLTVERSTFWFNRAAGARGADGGSGVANGFGGSGLGGGIFSDAGATLVVRSSTFVGDEALGGAGGDGGTGLQNGFGGMGGGGSLVALGAGASVTISGSRFIGDVARGGDGGIGQGTVNGFGGVAFGGAVFLASAGGSLNVDEVTFLQNQALDGTPQENGLGQLNGSGGNGAGGAVYNRGWTVSFSHTTFLHNQALGSDGGVNENPAVAGGTGLGGGLYVNSDAVVQVLDCVLTDNRADLGFGGNAGAGGQPGSAGLGLGGGVYFGAPGSCVSAGTRISDNAASDDGADVYGPFDICP